MNAHASTAQAERSQPVHIGDHLREWRQRRRMSQLDLALEAGVSARHVSFVETGRSRPSAEMVVQLAEHLEVPLRDRNALLLAAGYAPHSAKVVARAIFALHCISCITGTHSG